MGVLVYKQPTTGLLHAKSLGSALKSHDHSRKNNMTLKQQV